MQEDLLNAEKRLREQADKRDRQRLSEIRRLQEELKISSDSVRVLIGTLNASKEKYEPLIKDFAERYSKIDFDEIDDFNNEWVHYIHTGQLDKADSLLKTRSNLEEEHEAMREEVEQGRATIQYQKDRLRQNEETQARKEQHLLNKTAELADYYFKGYELAVLRYEYDEAASCLEKRAALDTTNATWQFEAADYFHRQNQFNNSEKYYKRALSISHRLSKANPQAYEPYLVTILGNLALLYFNTQRFDESETLYKEALDIYRKLATANPQAYEPYLAMYLDNLVLLYLSLDQQVQSYETYEELLPIVKRYYHINSEQYKNNYATALSIQSTLCIFMRKFAKAEQYARERIKVDPPRTFIYGNLAASLLLQGKYAEAEQIYRRYKDELKEDFLREFKQIEEAGIIPDKHKADVEKIKRLLNE